MQKHYLTINIINIFRIRLILILILILLFFSSKSKAVSNEKDSIHDILTIQIENIIDIINQDPDTALYLAKKDIDVASLFEFQNEKAELLRLIGLVWYYKVNYTLALNYFNQSYNLYLEIGNTKGVASALNNISLIYGDQGYVEKALKMSKQVLEMRKKLNNTDLLAGSYNNLGAAYSDLLEYDLALDNYKEAVNICLENNLTESIDLYYNNIGNIYLIINQLDSAYKYLNVSLAYSIPLNHKQMISNSYIYLGQYYFKRGSYQQAKDILQKGLKITKEIGIVYEIEWAAENLHEVYAKLGEYDNAYEMHKLYKQLADSANNLEITKKITQIESEQKYAKERELNQIIQNNKELENKLALNRQKQALTFTISIALALLLIAAIAYWNYVLKSKDNDKLLLQKAEITEQKEEIQKQRDRIEQLNSTKDKFFAIIAHDLRNPLSGIYKLSEVVYSNFDFLSTEKLKKYLDNIKTTSEKVYSLLDNLLQWASFQMGSLIVEPEVFDIGKLIAENKDLLTGLAVKKNINIEVESPVKCMSNADPKMINTVIRNLLTNALKFTPKNGNIKILVIPDGNNHIISVSDNGIGISKEDQKLLFTLANDSKTIGNSKDKGMGLGLILCDEFITLNRGKIWIESEPEKGSTFYISVPAER